MSEEEKKSIETQLLTECKAKEGGTDDDVAAMIKREHPSSKTGKCMAACIGETLGLVSMGEKFIYNGALISNPILDQKQ